MEQEQTIIIAGGTGMIGQHLADLLRGQKFKVFVLTRNQERATNHGYLYWNPAAGEITEDLPPSCHSVVNLAGAGIVDQPWTSEYKQTIIRSRVDSNKCVATLLDYYRGQPFFISASAVGYYGDRKSPGRFHENDKPAKGGFLQEVALQWEAAATAAGGFASRHVILRIGIVLSDEGGALMEMKKGFQMGIGSYVTPGDQHYSWIHVQDLCQIIHHAIVRPEIVGTYNAVAPEPVTAKELAKIMSTTLFGTSRLLPIPSFALRLALGQRREALQENCPVSADKIKSTGYTFSYPSCADAISDLL